MAPHPFHRVERPRKLAGPLLFAHAILRTMAVKWIVGIDEAGRGPLAGPLAFGAVAIRPGADDLLDGIRDSKKLTERAREQWHERLSGERAIVPLYGEIPVEKIDEFKMGKVIAAGSRSIARRMLQLLEGNKDDVMFYLDGSLRAPDDFRQESIVGGDASVPVIGAASVVAKVRRDRVMRELHCRYPMYGFNRHKGYGTKYHRERIREFGPSPEHRKSFTLQ